LKRQTPLAVTMQDTVWCDDCDCQMVSKEEIFECPVCKDYISWDAYYEQKAARWGRI